MADKLRQMESFYDQCLKAYEECRKGTGLLMNNMSSPSIFYDEYNIPSELLFNALCKKDPVWVKERYVFEWRLLEWVFNRKKWDIESFSEKRKSSLPIKKYSVYLELFYQCDNPKCRPFTRQLKIDNVCIEWCNKRDYQANYKNYVAEEQKRRRTENSYHISTIPDLVSDRRFPKISKQMEKYIHPIRAMVYSTNGFSAAVTALEKVDLLLNSLNVSQGIQKYSTRLFGGSSETLGSKTIFVTTGHYLVVGENEIDVYYTDDQILKLPHNKYNPIAWKRDLFRKIITCISDDCFMRDRIRNVVNDLSLAYSSTNAGIKILSYWRCLEHATRDPSRNRKELEIIEIFKRRHSSKHWKQMGDLVLESRNKYVHSGIYSGKEKFADNYINWAQKYAEQSLYLMIFLYKNRKIWKNEEELGAFFDNYAKSDKYIQAVGNISKIRRVKYSK